jgi:hypothetical protein
LSCLWRSSHKSPVCIAAVVFFCWSFLAVNLGLENVQRQHRTGRGHYNSGTGSGHAWLRQATSESSSVSFYAMNRRLLRCWFVLTAGPATATALGRTNMMWCVIRPLVQFQRVLDVGSSPVRFFKALPFPVWPSSHVGSCGCTDRSGLALLKELLEAVSHG